MTLLGLITHYKMLTPHVLELILEIPKEFPFVPGQRVLLGYQDEKSIFKRAYSIGHHEIKNGNTYVTLCIKLWEQGRGSIILKNKKIGDTIEVGVIAGHFKLQDTEAPKVFIGTGTGLVPVYNMAKHAKTKNNILIFAVPYKSELYYEEEIKNIPDLKYEIYITREEVPGYRFGRFDISTYNFTPDTEFYICGNPDMVKANLEKLKELGYEKVYSEQY